METDIEVFQKIHNMCADANHAHRDISESIPIFLGLGLGAQRVTEFGQGPDWYGLNSTIGLFYGLIRNDLNNKSFHCYDLVYNVGLDLIRDCSDRFDIEFKFYEENTWDANIQETDVLFIDSRHTYQHLTRELEITKDKVTTYIGIHDTSGKYSNSEDWPFDDPKRGDLADDPSKYGMWPAVLDFLKENDDWEIAYRHQVNHGLTTLKRKSAEGWVDFSQYNEKVKITYETFE